MTNMSAEMDIILDDEGDVDSLPVVSLRTEVRIPTSRVAVAPVMDIELDDYVIGVVPTFAETIQPMSHLLNQEWTWENMRDYVVSEVVKRHGKFPRNPIKEAAIFRSFIVRWGAERSQKVAKVAFEVHDGMWKGSPIRIERFCKSSDEFFAGVILND